MTTNMVMKLTRMLRSPDNKVVLQAIEDLRSYGWLEEGGLVGANLQHTHLQNADLYNANLLNANLRMAHLQLSNLSRANLQGACLSSADLYGADLNKANLQGANLLKANLQAVRNLTGKQLAEAKALWGAIMPDGSLYDGRFHLAGDLEFAQAGHVDIYDAQAMADFYRSSEEPIGFKTGIKDISFSSLSSVQLIRKLRSSDNTIVKQAMNELRARGQLTDGSLKWVFLKYVNFQGVDLSGADLNKADLSMAKLQGADLRGANLQGARLTKSNLRKAHLGEANLMGASLSKAVLQGALDATETQLAQTGRLRGATMPDGSRYDGRFNLSGDLADARFLNVDIHDTQKMAEFYGVSIVEYQIGQNRVKELKPIIWSEAVAHENFDEIKYDMESLVHFDDDISG